ncbi:MAG TPA: ABC transporter permease, partial [Saprospiraceae bacterium]|nr:ABC transporter permease [Saprospiraceae bacterium]
PQITSKIYPPIPYRFNSIDPLNSQFKSPFGKQNIKSLKYRHWLGTDQIGRDVLAGMINGARVSVEVGFLGIGLAAIIGILLGSFSGFFGNYRIKWSIGQWVITIVSLLALAWLAYVLPFYWPQNGGGIIFGLVLLFIFLQVGLSRINFKTKKIPVPVDGATIRLVEVFNAIPNLLLVLVISVLFPPSLLVVALVIGVTHWPMITLFVRGEMLKIRQREYLLAAKMQNIPEWKILWRHALPNAIGPALIVIMLGLGSAILAEAFLSFIGLGLPPDLVSWGKLLAASRENFSAWWMAVFPGLAIFLTIFSANRIGEILLEEMKAA